MLAQLGSLELEAYEAHSCPATAPTGLPEECSDLSEVQSHYAIFLLKCLPRLHVALIVFRLMFSALLFVCLFETEFSSCPPGWSAMARSWLTAISAFLDSRDSPASASQIAGIAGTCLDTQLIFVFLIETRFHHIGQAGLELLTSGDPLTLAPPKC